MDPEQRALLIEHARTPADYRAIVESYVDPRPSQDDYELSELLAIVAPTKPRVVLEIGVYWCGAFRVWRDVFQPELLIGVDDTQQPLDWAKLLGGFEDAIFIAPTRSQDAETRQRVVDKLGGREVDFLHIDGEHTYEGVKADFELYTPLVARGGWVALHDINVGPGLAQVQPFWNEIKGGYKHREFNRTTGIGLIWWGA